jgi:hypothetical protein
MQANVSADRTEWLPERNTSSPFGKWTKRKSENDAEKEKSTNIVTMNTDTSVKKFPVPDAD